MRWLFSILLMSLLQAWLVEGFLSSSPYNVIQHHSPASIHGINRMRLHASQSDQLSLPEIQEYAKLSSLKLIAKETGPYLRLEAFPAGSDELIGYLTAFIRPFPFGMLQLETIQVKNRRQNLGFKREGWTIDGPGISFIMGSYALSWAYARGCRRTQLLAVNDSPQMHKVLIRMYAGFGFKTLREVTEDNVQDRLVWGAVGTLMEMELDSFFKEWRPKFNVLMMMSKRREEEESFGQQQQQPSLTTSTSSNPTPTPTNSIPNRGVSKVKVALTREDGANGKLAKLIGGGDSSSSGCEVVELPCIMFADGEDSSQLPQALTASDIIVITSPQAASVFLSAWEIAGRPSGLKVASVGKGTSSPLIKAGITPIFEPSDSTAETLASELPSSLGSSVLYPSSAIAENTLAKGLEQRGFKVTRLNTYSTVPAVWTEQQTQLARSVDIVTFGSPSAVKTWAEKVGAVCCTTVVHRRVYTDPIYNNQQLYLTPLHQSLIITPTITLTQPPPPTPTPTPPPPTPPPPPPRRVLITQRSLLDPPVPKQQPRLDSKKSSPQVDIYPLLRVYIILILTPLLRLPPTFCVYTYYSHPHLLLIRILLILTPLLRLPPTFCVYTYYSHPHLLLIRILLVLTPLLRFHIPHTPQDSTPLNTILTPLNTILTILNTILPTIISSLSLSDGGSKGVEAWADTVRQVAEEIVSSKTK